MTNPQIPSNCKKTLLPVYQDIHQTIKPMNPPTHPHNSYYSIYNSKMNNDTVPTFQSSESLGGRGKNQLLNK